MLGFNVERFPGLTSEDFAAFEQRKWSSNRFNLERMKTREKLEALGRCLGGRLESQMDGLFFRTTLDHPHIFNLNQVRSCWLYIDRPEDEKGEITRILDKDLTTKEKVQSPIPEQRFACVGVDVSNEGCSLFFRVHAQALLDRRNFVARLAETVEQQQFLALLSRLPPEFNLRFSDETRPLPRSLDELRGLRSAIEGEPGWFGIERVFEKVDPLLAEPSFDNMAAEAIPPLLAIWRFAAWTRANDRLKLAPVLKEEKKLKAKKLAGFEPGDKVLVVSGLLGGKQGTVLGVDLKGRVKISLGRLSIEIDAKNLRKS